MKKTITILILLLTVGFLSFSQDIKPISPLFKNLQSPSFSFMIGGNPWIYKGTAFNPTPWTELAGWTNVKDTLNNYFTKSIVQAKIDSLANVKQDTITLTTIGTSGAATFIGSTLNIPQYSGGAEPGHDSLTIAPGSTDYFDINYPQIFSGQKLIDSLGVINTKIAGKEPLLTKGNLTAGSSKVTIGGTGTNALIGAGASVDVNEANIVHQNISGSGTNTHAQIDTHITNDGDLSSTNEIQDLSLSGNTLSLSGDASTVDLSGYAPAFSGTANYIPKFGLSGATLENSQLSQSGLDYLILDNQYAGILFKKSGANKFIFGDDAFLTATRPDAYGFYLYGDNVIDFWTNSTRIATFGQSSGIQFPSLAGSGTRLVASQSDGKLANITNASGYLYNDGTGNMIWIKTVPQSLSGTTPTLNASNGVNANLSISGATTLTLSNLISGTSGTIYITNNASVYRIKIAGYTIAPASNITYDSTGILLPASSVYTHTSIGWYYNGTTVQIHKADYNLTTH